MKRFILLPLSLILMCPLFMGTATFRAPGEYTDFCADENCQLCLRGDGVGFGIDESGNDYQGNFGGNAAITTSGKEGNGFTFDGTGDYLNVGTMETFGSGLDTAIASVVGWVKSSNTSSIENFFGTLNTGFNTIFELQLNSNSSGSLSSGRIFAQIRDEDAVTFNGGVDTDTGITDGEWHHIAIVYNAFPASNRSVTIYLDGVEQSFTTGVGNQVDNTANFEFGMVIGSRNNRATIDQNFNGQMDEIAFFNRALTAAEVVEIYTYGLR